MPPVHPGQLGPDPNRPQTQAQRGAPRRADKQPAAPRLVAAAPRSDSKLPAYAIAAGCGDPLTTSQARQADRRQTEGTPPGLASVEVAGQMCGRYTNTAGPEELGERFAVRLPDGRGTRRFNIAPTEEVLVVRAAEGRREAELMRWGLLPGWALTAKRPYALINVRAETALEKQTFARLLADPGRRALQVADGWYEWLAAERPGLARQPFRFTIDGGAPFAFAAIWTEARGGDGASVRSVALLTRQAVGKAAQLHSRMPVVLADPDLQAEWLANRLSPAELLELCSRPPADQRIEVAPANQALNRPGTEEGPYLLSAG